MTDNESLRPEDQKAAVEILEGIVRMFKQYPLPQHLEVALKKIHHILNEVNTTCKFTKRLWNEYEADIQLLLKFQENKN
jgi:hypothetical protein